MGFKKGNKAAKGGRRPGAGRKPGIVSVTRQQLAEQDGPSAWSVLVKIMNDETAPVGDRRDAAKFIFEHWAGRAPARVEAAVSGEVTIRVKYDDGG